MQTPRRKRYQKDSNSDDIYLLIKLVRENPAIYNYKLQPHRRRVDVLDKWAQIAAQIGNKYTVEECRRKWKNLRDTYHQYRLRKSKQGDGLSKWRYAKDLEFLSTVYQPKLKSQRKQEIDVNSHILQVASCSDTKTIHSNDEMIGSHNHPDITLVSDEAETFILTAYEESVNDSVHELTHHGHDDDIVEHIVKNEHGGSLDGMVDDGGADNPEVDYEEVCLYEETNVPTASDCETIHTAPVCINHEDRESKSFQYIDANDFCIDAINTHTQLPSNMVNGNNVAKLKNIMNVVNGNMCENNNEITAVTSANSMDSATTMTGLIQFQSPISVNRPTNGHVREELDLFFDFLKKKIQYFSKEEISAIQIDILNCVLRREAESAQKFSTIKNGRSQ